MNRKFLLCRRCGNLIELINDSGVTPICCGIDMVLLTANSTEAATEKHIPVIEKEGTTVKITIGETLHPMGIKRVNLRPGEEPIAYFALLENEKIIKAYSYCNLHGLWVKEI